MRTPERTGLGRGPAAPVSQKPLKSLLKKIKNKKRNKQAGMPKGIKLHRQDSSRGMGKKKRRENTLRRQQRRERHAKKKNQTEPACRQLNLVWLVGCLASHFFPLFGRPGGADKKGLCRAAQGKWRNAI